MTLSAIAAGSGNLATRSNSCRGTPGPCTFPERHRLACIRVAWEVPLHDDRPKFGCAPIFACGARPRQRLGLSARNPFNDPALHSRTAKWTTRFILSRTIFLVRTLREYCNVCLTVVADDFVALSYGSHFFCSCCLLPSVLRGNHWVIPTFP